EMLTDGAHLGKLKVKLAFAAEPLQSVIGQASYGYRFKFKLIRLSDFQLLYRKRTQVNIFNCVVGKQTVRYCVCLTLASAVYPVSAKCRHILRTDIHIPRGGKRA